VYVGVAQAKTASKTWGSSLKATCMLLKVTVQACAVPCLWLRPNEAPYSTGNSLQRNLSHAIPKSFLVTLDRNTLCVAKSHLPQSTLEAGDDVVPPGTCTTVLSCWCPGRSIHPCGCGCCRSSHGQGAGCAVDLAQGEPWLCPHHGALLRGRHLNRNTHQGKAECLRPRSRQCTALTQHSREGLRKMEVQRSHQSTGFTWIWNTRFSVSSTK